MKEKFYTVVTIVMVCSAIVIMCLVLQKEFFKEDYNISNLQYIYGWEKMVGIAGNAYQKGHDRAKVTVLLFFDYQCPYCKQLNINLSKLYKKYADEIKISYLHRPIINPDFTYKIAVVSECARLQNNFKPFHDALFKEQMLSDDISFTKLANQTGANNLEKFSKCVEDEQTDDIVEGHIALSNKLDINAVPTLIVNGRIIKGAASFEYLERIIQQILGENR